MALSLAENPALSPVRDAGVVLGRGRSSAADAVRAVQEALAAFGLRVGVDGVYGPGTEEAVLAYQREAGLPADGRFGAYTLHSLEEALARGAHHVASVAEQPLPGIWSGDRFGARVAMTFDDGPHAELTPGVLDTLNAAGIKGHFFMVGRQVAARPELVRRVVAEGHGVGNHSWDHPDYGKLTAEQVKRQLQDTEKAIQDALGCPIPGPKLARPPYGSPFFDAPGSERKKRVAGVLGELGYGCVMWTVDPQDWAHPGDPDAVVREALHQLPAGRGGVVLLHDVHTQSAAALPRILAAFSERKLEASSLGALWNGKYPPRIA